MLRVRGIEFISLQSRLTIVVMIIYLVDCC